MPRYDRFERLRHEISNSVEFGRVNVSWDAVDKSMYYAWHGKNHKFDLTRMQVEIVERIPESARNRPARNRRAPERGRQFDRIESPDGKRIAFYRDRNLYLSDPDGKNEVALTSDATAQNRMKYGQASWVYGEELGVRDAMWFSPNGEYLAYYRFDESEVKDYYLAQGQTQFQTRLDVEAYPKAGHPNPKVALLVRHLASGKVIEVDATFADRELGHYVYQVRWSPKGDELHYHRTNRKQNVMQFCAADPATGRSRVIVEEKRPASWTDNVPKITWLADETRFLWISERSGFYNLYLGHLDGRPLQSVTQHAFEVEQVLRVKEDEQAVYYTARSGDNPYKLQLHRVRLDGQFDQRLTDPQFHHTIQISPFEHFFVSTYENLDRAPETALFDGMGRRVKVLATSNTEKFERLQLRKVERVEFTAADGKTKLYGYFHKPSDFDPNAKYPLLVDVYAGPDSGGGFETFRLPNPATEFGFLVASFEGRGTLGRGKDFKEAVYRRLGVAEIADQAAGVKALASRPYVDAKRVGIEGTSYGGYAVIMALLRHPNVFHVGVAQSSVTDWRHYDTIYTERYMGLPTAEDNLEGYDAGSAMKYVANLKGRLLLFYGSSDNNVHPANSLMLAEALNRAGKSYDMMVGPDQGHVGIGFARTWEFLIDHLIVQRSQTFKQVFDHARQSLAARKKATPASTAASSDPTAEVPALE